MRVVMATFTVKFAGPVRGLWRERIGGVPRTNGSSASWVLRQ
ncbi:hypothetical protein ABH927_004062 [Planotetraspora sp. GP83]